MIFQLILTFLAGTFFSFFLFSLTNLSIAAHGFCQSLAPQSPYESLNLAIVCGKSISRESFFKELSLLGLVHIIVVSGAHLALLSDLFSKISFQKLPQKLTFFLLLIFVFCCQLQLPVLRAWIFLILKKIDHQFKLFNSTPFNILLSVVFCLSFHSQSYFHISLPMSWLACLAIYKGKNVFTQSTLCYLFLFPVLMSFQILHPWSIVINTLITPLLSLLLFPLALFSFLITPLSPVVDFLWQLLFIFSEKVAPLMTIHKVFPEATHSLLIWLYPLTLNLYFIYKK